MNNDLISREALKKALELTDYNDIYDLTRTEQLIDNAPTVDISGSGFFPYRTAFFNGVRAGQATARTQGEWIRTGSLGNGNARYECSNCHRGDVQAESQEVPYCWHCGAKMQKGGAE